MRANRRVGLFLFCLSGAMAWADTEFKGTTTGSFQPSNAQGPLQFTGGIFDVTNPPDPAPLTNLGKFVIDKSSLTCLGTSCYVENWNLDPVTFTMTFHFTMPGVNGIQDFSAPVAGTIQKNGNSSNFNVSNVTIHFNNNAQNFTFDENGVTRSFDLTVFDPAAMDLTLNPSHSSVSTTVTGQISNVRPGSNVSTLSVPEAANPFNLFALPAVLIFGRRILRA